MKKKKGTSIDTDADADADATRTESGSEREPPSEREWERIILSNCIALQFIISFVIILRILNKNEDHAEHAKWLECESERANWTDRAQESGERAHVSRNRQRRWQRRRSRRQRRRQCCQRATQGKVKISFRFEHSTCADVPTSVFPVSVSTLSRSRVTGVQIVFPDQYI